MTRLFAFVAAAAVVWLAVVPQVEPQPTTITAAIGSNMNPRAELRRCREGIFLKARRGREAEDPEHRPGDVESAPGRGSSGDPARHFPTSRWPSSVGWRPRRGGLDG